MRAADGGAPPPGELLLKWLCGDTRLPEVGGVMDQDYETINRMTVLGNIYNTVVRYRRASGKQIHQLTDSERRILKSLKDRGHL